MSKLDDLKNKAKDLVTDNRDKIEQGVDKAGNLVNDKTGGKHSDKVDKVTGKVTEGLDKVTGDQSADPAGENPPTPPPAPPAPNSYSAPMATGPAEPPQPTTPPLTPG